MKIDLVGPRQRGLAMGLNEAAGYGAVAVSSLLAGYLATEYGLRPAPFLLGIAYTALALIITGIFVRETHGHAHAEAAQLTPATTRPSQDAGLTHRRTWFLASIGEPALASASLAGLVNNLNFGPSWGLFPLLFATRDLPTAQIAILFALYPGVWGIGQLFTGALSDRIGRKHLVTGGMALQAIALVIIGAGSSLTVWATGTILLGLGTAMSTPPSSPSSETSPTPPGVHVPSGSTASGGTSATPSAQSSAESSPTSSACRPRCGSPQRSPRSSPRSSPGGCTRLSPHNTATEHRPPEPSAVLPTRPLRRRSERARRSLNRAPSWPYPTHLFRALPEVTGRPSCKYRQLSARHAGAARAHPPASAVGATLTPRSPMGSITAYEIAAGKRYRVRWRDDQQKQVEKKGFRTKKDAELYLAHTEVSRSNGSYTDPGEARITVGALGVEWLRNKKHALKASSFSSLNTSWRVYVLPRWGDVRIGDIRASHVEQWIRELSEGTATTTRTKSAKAGASPRSASVVYRALGVLAGILDTAVRDGRIPRNVARGAQNLPPKQSQKPRRYLTHSEVELRVSLQLD